jgi:hypothetical protein
MNNMILICIILIVFKFLFSRKNESFGRRKARRKARKAKKARKKAGKKAGKKVEKKAKIEKEKDKALKKGKKFCDYKYRYFKDGKCYYEFDGEDYWVSKKYKKKLINENVIDINEKVGSCKKDEQLTIDTDSGIVSCSKKSNLNKRRPIGIQKNRLKESDKCPVWSPFLHNNSCYVYPYCNASTFDMCEKTKIKLDDYKEKGEDKATKFEGLNSHLCGEAFEFNRGNCYEVMEPIGSPEDSYVEKNNCTVDPNHKNFCKDYNQVMRYEGKVCEGGFFTRFKGKKMGCLKSMKCGMGKYKDLEECKPYNVKVPSKYCIKNPESIFLNEDNDCVNFIDKNKTKAVAVKNNFCPGDKPYEFGGICHEYADMTGDVTKATEAYKSSDGRCPESPQKADYIIKDQSGNEFCITPKKGVSFSKCLAINDLPDPEVTNEIINDCQLKPRLWEENRYCPSDLRFLNKSDYTCNKYQHPSYNVEKIQILGKGRGQGDKCKLYKYYDYKEGGLDDLEKIKEICITDDQFGKIVRNEEVTFK